jgi:hypothetical protein
MSKPLVKRKNYVLIDFEEGETTVFHDLKAIQEWVSDKVNHTCRDVDWVSNNFRVYEIKEHIPITATVKTMIQFGLGAG